MYLRIQDEMRRRILAGDYRSDEPLPSQRSLSAEFGVTVMTLRQAIEQLKGEGLLITRPGTGTFAVPRRFAYSIGPLRSLSQEMAVQGLTMGTEVLASERRDAPAQVAAHLGTGDVWFLERVRSIDGSPAVYQRSWLPAGLGRAAARHDLTSRSLYAVYAEELGIVVARAREWLYPVVLGADEAGRLHEETGTAALLSERLTLDEGDGPILFDQAFIPGARMVITAERQTNDMSIRYELRDRVPGPLAPAPAAAHVSRRAP